MADIYMACLFRLRTLTFAGITEIPGAAATFFDDASTFSCFAFLFFLQFLSGFLAQQQLKKDIGKVRLGTECNWVIGLIDLPGVSSSFLGS